jgi:hypothetical protein
LKLLNDEDLQRMAHTVVDGVGAGNEAAGVTVACVVLLGELEPGSELRHTNFVCKSNLPPSAVAEVLELALAACEATQNKTTGSA